MSEWVTKPASAEAIGMAPHPLVEARSLPPGSPFEGDPARAILRASNRLAANNDWFYTGVLLAIALHLAVLGYAFAKNYLWELRDLLQATRAELHEYFWTQYDVDLAPKPKPVEEKPEEQPPPPPDPAPAPVAAPAPKAEPKLKDDPYEQPPPAPAQAAKVLTQPADDDPDKVEDLTGFKIVSGEGSAVGGMQSAQGKGNTITKAPNANLNGVPGGTGTGTAPVAAAPGAPDRSQPATLVGGSSWSCPFPPEADAEQIDSAVVTLVVTVRPDGSPLSASVISDPGHGFGRAARLCALGRRYNAALDKTGAPITAQTPPIKVRFTR